MFVDRFITRPVLSTVISVIFVILGVVSLFRLPITQFPEIAPPSIVVIASYPGASAETVARSVAPPLEMAINGAEGMTYMTSTSGNDGTCTITIYFALGTDPDMANVRVQNRVSQAQNELPAAVLTQGITVEKKQNSVVMFISIRSDNKTFDQTFLQNYSQIYVVPVIQRVDGVGQAQILTQKQYAMRVWLEPKKMASLGLTPGDISSAITSQSFEAAPGKFGEQSTEAMEYILKYPGRFTTPEEFGNIVIRGGSDAQMLFLRDVARIELGSFDYSVSSLDDGQQAAVMGVFQVAGSNANQIQIDIEAALEELAKDFPDGVTYEVLYSTKHSLDQSIDQVRETLIEAFLLVFLVVFIFLQDFRSTLIPAIAVPVAIIGSFFVMTVFGFSINVLTLFAIVLAIGIVVDDAIVVVEAVHARMEGGKLSAVSATSRAMGDIAGAIISITLVMSSVFFPVSFMAGPVGVFYRQFALTLAGAIIISAINALTLSPALCALFLKSEAHEEKKGFGKRFFSAFNTAFTAVTGKYVSILHQLIRFKWISLGGLALVAFMAFFLFKSTPSGFIPDEDNGFCAVAVNLPPGASVHRTEAFLAKAAAVLQKDPAVANVTTIGGSDLLSGAGIPSKGIMYVKLKEQNERGPVSDIKKLVMQFNQQLYALPEADCFVLTMPTVPGYSSVSGVQFVLQDQTFGELKKFNQLANSYIGDLMQRPEVGMAFTTFSTDYPQYNVVVDAKKASQLGLTTADVMNTIQGYYGTPMPSDFNRFGQYYRVILQSEYLDRTDASTFSGIYIRNKDASMVPASSVARLERVYGSETIDHFNLFNSITITANPNPGYSTGQVIAAIEDVAEATLPPGFDYQWEGMSLDEVSTGGQTAAIFLLSIIFVYFLLSAQYESYILPFAVMLSIPTGILGVFIGVKLGGIDNNIYVQVALIMLIGLLSKNAILIVEYALQRRQSGLGIIEAAIDGAKARFRPILMTSFAFVFGLMPLIKATGPAAQGNHSIGWAAVSGMLSGVLLGVFIIPVLFVIFQSLQEHFTGPAHVIEDAHASEDDAIQA